MSDWMSASPSTNPESVSPVHGGRSARNCLANQHRDEAFEFRGSDARAASLAKHE